MLVTREKTQKILQHILHLHAYMYLLTLLTFLFYQFCKNYEFIIYGFYLVRLLVLILIRVILEQSINNKMASKIQFRMSSTDIYLYWCKIYSHL